MEITEFYYERINKFYKNKKVKEHFPCVANY